MRRPGLIVIQVLGALTILPYPFVLLANIMSIAAQGQTAVGALPFILLSLYPLVWIVLYVLSWMLLSRGRAGWAFGLSTVPLVAGLALVSVLGLGFTSMTKSGAVASDKVRKEIEPANPLLWTIWCSGWEHRFPPGGPQVPVDQAIKAIEANTKFVNVAVPPYGTPLKLAVENLSMKTDGSFIGDGQRQRDLLRVVKALVAHGARYSEAESKDLKQQWRLRRALYAGPVNTESENPLVWRLLTRKRDGVTLFSLHQDEIPMLNQSTTLHGTPLYAALLGDEPDAYPDLIKAGAHLSVDEGRDPAARAALNHVLEHDSELRKTYGQ